MKLYFHPRVKKVESVHVCAWCSRHILGRGHLHHGLYFCNWSHALMWMVDRQHNHNPPPD